VNAPTVGRSTPFPKVVAFFRRHPVLLLLCFSPGIPEYLSGSSSVEGIVVAPAVFFLFLGFNLALYGPGVLLIREAFVRWRKGWAALLCLGAAYGLLEEGTALSTLFNPKASVVGGLGFYGHYAGVSWVWAIGVLQIHVVLSIGLPIVLLGLALPETRGRPLLSRREVTAAFGIFAVDIVLLALVSHYYPIGLLWQGLAVVVAGGLTLLAYRLPANLLDPTSKTPRYRPGTCFVLGLLFYPILLLVPAFGEALHLAAPITGVADIALSGALFFTVRHAVGRTRNDAQLVMVAFGAILPIVLFGLVAQIFLPIVLVFDVLFGLFFYSLWRRYRPAPGETGPAVPLGAS
jgi:hypothetical protein